MHERALATLRQILHAAARVLGCGSTQLALVDTAQQALVIRVAVANRDAARLAAVESALGFDPEGAALALTVSNSLLVRSIREGRIFMTQNFGDLAGERVPLDVSRQIDSVIGSHSFAIVPILGRTRALGVIIFEKPGTSTFSPADRDLLVAYAERVGAEIEAETLSEQVAALALPPESTPPTLYSCALTSVAHGPTRDAEPHAALRVSEGPATGQELADALGVPESTASILHNARLALASEQAVTLSLGSSGRSLRVTFFRTAPDRLVAACESLGWQEHLRQTVTRAVADLTKVLSSLDDAILRLDTDGRIIDCNAAARTLLVAAGAGADLHGRSLADLLHDQRSRRRAQDISRRLERTGFAEAELTFCRGEEAMPARVSALALADPTDRFTGAIYRIRDLTERKRGDAERRSLKARLLRSERLSALGEMAARIAHEVRNPLVSIGATARLIEEELPPASTVLEDARAISREVRRLDGILSDFLRFARPRPIERRPQAIDRLLDETLDLMRAKADGIAFQVEVHSPRPVMVRCDGDAIRQVLWNVLLNAVEASPPGGAIRCELRRDKGEVAVVIDDEGPGVPREARRRAFDPFFSTKARGTGLGLAVSKQIIDEHEGSIRLVARQPRGTRVLVELPG